MEAKKHKNRDLERNRFVFFQIGLLLALGFTFMAFEYKTTDFIGYTPWSTTLVSETEDFTPVTWPEKEIKQEVVKVKPIELVIVDEIIKKEVDLSYLESDFSSKDIIDFDLPDDDTFIEDNVPIYTCEKMPEYPGGTNALLREIADNVIYPKACVENGIEGIVYVKFVVDKNGNIIDVELRNSVHPLLDKEAVNVMKTLKRYTPGSHNGKPVNVIFSVPISFSLRSR